MRRVHVRIVGGEREIGRAWWTNTAKSPTRETRVQVPSLAWWEVLASRLTPGVATPGEQLDLFHAPVAQNPWVVESRRPPRPSSRQVVWSGRGRVAGSSPARSSRVTRHGDGPSLLLSGSVGSKPVHDDPSCGKVASPRATRAGYEWVRPASLIYLSPRCHLETL